MSLELSIENTLDQLPLVADAVENFCEDIEIPETVGVRINIVFDELLSNIISYAYGDNETHFIQILIEKRDGCLVIRIEDDGFPFNPFDQRDPDTESGIEERAIGGLGIHIVHQMMDKTSYERHEDRNIVVLEKRL
jgi:anti-sigma regulatory factor (Ser/Thr protein kinase)